MLVLRKTKQESKRKEAQEALRIISDDALYDRVLNEGATRNTDKVSKNNDTY